MSALSGPRPSFLPFLTFCAEEREEEKRFELQAYCAIIEISYRRITQKKPVKSILTKQK